MQIATIPNIRQAQTAAIDPERVRALLRKEIRAQYEKQFGGAMNAAALDASSDLSIRNIEHVVKQVIETKFGKQYAAELLPIGSDGTPPFAGEIVYERVTEIGLAGWVISGNMPWTDVATVEERRKVRTMGNKVGWTFFELEEARSGGKALDQSKLRAQARSVTASREIVLIAGDAGIPNAGLVPTGFINDPSVPTTSAAGGAWSGLDGHEIVDAILAMLVTYRTNVRETMDPTHLLLPTAQYHRLLAPLNDGSDKSILAYLREILPDLTIRELPHLAGAGVSGANRAVLFHRNEEVVLGVIPLTFRVLNPETHDLTTSVSAIERNAGVVFKFPPGCLYIDGV